MIKRLQIKFICINMAVVTVMLAVLLGMVVRFSYEDQKDLAMEMLQRVLVEDGNPGREYGGPPPQKEDHPPESGEESLPPRPDAEGRQPGKPKDIWMPWIFVTWDSEGQLQILSDGFGGEPDPKLVEHIVQKARESDQREGLLWRHQLRFAKHRRPDGEEFAFVDIRGEIETMTGLANTCFLVGIGGFFAFLGLSFLLARWAVRPVEKAWIQQRQFLADASHELKTPLTVIMTNAEMLQRSGFNDRDRKIFSENILVMSHQMRSLVEGLLELARLDCGTRKRQADRLDMSDLTENALLPFEPVYFEQNLQLESALDPGIILKGNRGQLNQLLDILLDNGAKYTTPGGTVLVTLQRHGCSCLLSVSGPGESISREDLKNLFRRFYRGDKSRNRDGGYGIGLAIADSIVKEHGGKIWAQSENGINTFFVQLPIR